MNTSPDVFKTIEQKHVKEIIKQLEPKFLKVVEENKQYGFEQKCLYLFFSIFENRLKKSNHEVLVMCAESEQERNSLLDNLNKSYETSLKSAKNLMKIQKFPLDASQKFLYAKKDATLVESYITFVKEGINVGENLVFFFKIDTY